MSRCGEGSRVILPGQCQNFNPDENNQVHGTNSFTFQLENLNARQLSLTVKYLFTLLYLLDGSLCVGREGFLLSRRPKGSAPPLVKYFRKKISHLCLPKTRRKIGFAGYFKIFGAKNKWPLHLLPSKSPIDYIEVCN